MGCSKNLVDSELLMKQFEANGYHCVHDSKRPQGEIAVINTCGFIGDAKQESIDTILEFVQRKQEGKVRKLYVMGCLSQRYQKELEAEIPEVDKFYGKYNYKLLLSELGKAEVPACNGRRHLTTPPLRLLRYSDYYRQARKPPEGGNPAGSSRNGSGWCEGIPDYRPGTYLLWA